MYSVFNSPPYFFLQAALKIEVFKTILFAVEFNIPRFVTLRTGSAGKNGGRLSAIK
jgi:hypothetical protein